MPAAGLPPGTIAVLVRLRAGEPIGIELSQWAMDALEVDHDSPALRQLAALNLEPPARISDAGPLFERATAELGLTLPGDDDLLMLFLQETAEAIAAGAEPLHGLIEAVHRLVVDPLDHPRALDVWCSVWTRSDPDALDRTEPLTDDELRALARRWVADQQQ
jgi:hypothetical protein